MRETDSINNTAAPGAGRPGFAQIIARMHVMTLKSSLDPQVRDTLLHGADELLAMWTSHKRLERENALLKAAIHRITPSAQSRLAPVRVVEHDRERCGATMVG